ncbi:DUF4012 domain-containing protein [Microbacterium sp. NPDC077644]|uniref:DUF4012 domain-containing protein n=1 Tax=Microbacterium sp. NPDC077644 TaxID=3155055 RepID=UPI00344EDF62
MPFVGPNLHAVRTAAAVTDDLVTGAVAPATSLSLKALTPVDGAINLDAITAMQGTVTQAADTIDKASSDLDAIDEGSLIPQVEEAVAQLTGAVDELQPMVGPARDILGVLPAALGADGPRNYLTIFQNNAESRGTGGNPAAIVMITADKGKISITQQASSANFKNDRPEPIIPLDPELEALYGDKVGRWISDATMSPDFSESAEILRAYWAESFGTPVDAVVSFDPVALSYLLKATGPATISNEPVEINGVPVQIFDAPITLNAENAVPLLLNQAYWKFPDGQLQDAFFAAAAKSVFDALISGTPNPTGIVDSLVRAVEENRLLYDSADEDEAALVGESKLSGRLPSTNDDRTLVGVYANDFTSSKLDYYMQLDVAATSTQCSNPEKPLFTTTATLENTVTPEQAPNLPYHIAPARFFERGTVATYLVFYGPVGSTFAGAAVDGKSIDAKGVQHLGRGAVKIAVKNLPGQTHTVTAEFTGVAGEYGEFDIQHTPMVRPVNQEVSAEGCD